MKLFEAQMLAPAELAPYLTDPNNIYEGNNRWQLFIGVTEHIYEVDNNLNINKNTRFGKDRISIALEFTGARFVTDSSVRIVDDSNILFYKVFDDFIYAADYFNERLATIKKQGLLLNWAPGTNTMPLLRIRGSNTDVFAKSEDAKLSHLERTW